VVWDLWEPRHEFQPVVASYRSLEEGGSHCLRFWRMMLSPIPIPILAKRMILLLLLLFD